MKKFVKGRWFPLIAAAIASVIVALVMALFGWKLTYAPDLENSWEAISACATWFGVFASFIAIIIAIFVPKEIADRQDKIALFEKRMECYTTIQNLLVAAKQMKDVQVDKGVQVAFRMYLGQPENIVDNISATSFALQLKQKQAIIVSGEFLFPRYDTELLQKIIGVGVDLIMQTAARDIESANVPLSARAEQLKTEYCQLCNQYENTYLESMEEELQLNNNT